MTREEEIKQAAENFLDKNKNIYFYADAFEGGAKWADEHPILEVKEVDLEREIQQHINDCLDPTTDIKAIAKDVEYTARKFFELGLKAQKVEE